MDTGDYYCTWATQARVRPADIADDSLDVRNNLNEEFLFGKNGVLSEYFQHIRGDLTVLLDDGWTYRWEPKTPRPRALRLAYARFRTFPAFYGQSSRAPFCNKRQNQVASLGFGLLASAHARRNLTTCRSMRTAPSGKRRRTTAAMPASATGRLTGATGAAVLTTA